MEKLHIFLYTITIAAIIYIIVKQSSKNKNDNESNNRKSNANEHNNPNQDYLNAYTPKWLFSVNERDAFIKIKHVTDSLNLVLLAKVRLLDLIEPKHGIKNYKGALWKIQAKHVDFVICTDKLIPKIIIELDDSSHDLQARMERDAFVDDVLTKAGYRVMHLWAINELRLEQQIKDILKLEENT